MKVLVAISMLLTSTMALAIGNEAESKNCDLALSVGGGPSKIVWSGDFKLKAACIKGAKSEFSKRCKNSPATIGFKGKVIFDGAGVASIPETTCP